MDIIGGIAQLLSTGINNAAGAARESAARAENYKYNEMAADNADARTRKLYEDLQSPYALLQQYQQAGLSPSLMFGGSGVGAGGMTQGAQGAGASGISPTTFGIDPMAAAQIGLIKAQTDKTNAETETIEGTNDRGKAEIDKLVQQVNNEWLTGEILALDKNLKEFEVAIQGEWGEKTAEAEYKKLIAEGDNLRATLRILKAKGKIDEESADSIIKYYQQRVIEQQADIFQKQMDAKLKASQIELNKTQIQQLLADISFKSGILEIGRNKVQIDRDKLDAQVEQWCKENGLTERGQNIQIAKVCADFFVGNMGNVARLIDSFIPN